MSLSELICAMVLCVLFFLCLPSSCVMFFLYVRNMNAAPAADGFLSWEYYYLCVVKWCYVK
jgi:hypothetical protein